MNFTILYEYFVLIVLRVCLVVGYVVKHATFLKWIPNGDIPVILAIVGAGVNSVVSGFTIENVVLGAVMGLASTCLHQAFSNFVENKKTE